MNEDRRKWAKSILDKVIMKMETVVLRNRGKICYTTDSNGLYDDRSKGNLVYWWTNGMWGGILWELYSLTENPIYQEEAIYVEQVLDTNLHDYDRGLTHDNGFKWLPTSVYRYRTTGFAESRNRALLAASHLAGRFNESGRFIRAWNDKPDCDDRGWAIIDCMMNLPLLYWASDELDDPRFRKIAIAHADTTIKNFFRTDGSVSHIVSFDINTGERICEIGGQGYSPESAWTRGQAWSIYGFAMSYFHTKERKYLDASICSADYFISQIPADGLIPVDFKAPKIPHWEDSTAAAIAAAGMLLIATLDKDSSERMEENAFLLIKSLVDKRCAFDNGCDNILKRCSEAYHRDNHDFPIMYADYFFIDALIRMAGFDFPVW